MNEQKKVWRRVEGEMERSKKKKREKKRKNKQETSVNIFSIEIKNVWKMFL